MASSTLGWKHDRLTHLEMLESVVSRAPIVLFSTDPDGIITLSRGHALSALGLGQNELVGRSVFDLYYDEPAVAASARSALEGQTVVVRLHLDGIWHETRFEPMFESDGSVSGILGVATDITEQVRLEEKLRQHATIDLVTGLPNRTWLVDRVEERIGAEQELRPFAILQIGLDHFREVNETYGFRYGDEVLGAVGRRLQSFFDDRGDVARSGGDEFAVLLHTADVQRSLEQSIERLQAAFDEPFEIQGEPIAVEASVGASLYPGHGHSAEMLLRRAHAAMFAAKRTGVGTVKYEAQRDEIRINNVRLLAELRTGLEAEQFVFYYQPKIDLATGAVVGVEALVRWEHPKRGLVLPSEFIPLAERGGLMRRLLPWSTNEVARQHLTWRREGHRVPVAINLSARAFQNRRLPEHFSGLLDTWGLSGEDIEVEITETAIMADVSRATQIAEQLHGMGIRIAIDDFGIGQSPLVYLRQLNPYAVKVDRSFVMDLDNRDSEAVVEMIATLGKRMDIRVIAEGIERPELMERLRALGCHEGQGFAIGRPMPGDELSAWLRSGAGPECGQYGTGAASTHTGRRRARVRP